MLSAKLRENTPDAIARAQEAMIGQALSLADGSLTEYELTRAINRYESNYTFGSISFLAKAQALALSEMHDEDINSTVPHYRSVTVDDIIDTTRSIIDPQRASTLIYTPA